MKSFNVIIWEPNFKKFIPYDIMPYLIDTYNDLLKRKWKKIPKTYEDFKEFVKSESMYQFWGRCEYEIILVDWPCQTTEKKTDVYSQIEMNLDIVTNIFIENINGD